MCVECSVCMCGVLAVCVECLHVCVECLHVCVECLHVCVECLHVCAFACELYAQQVALYLLLSGQIPESLTKRILQDMQYTS